MFCLLRRLSKFFQFLCKECLNAPDIGVHDRRIGLRFFFPKTVGGKGLAFFNAWHCLIIAISGLLSKSESVDRTQTWAVDRHRYRYGSRARRMLYVHATACALTHEVSRARRAAESSGRAHAQ
jgi:hypothetical protein